MFQILVKNEQNNNLEISFKNGKSIELMIFQRHKNSEDQLSYVFVQFQHHVRRDQLQREFGIHLQNLIHEPNMPQKMTLVQIE